MNNQKNQSREIIRIFNKIAPIYDFLNRLFSLREDIRWRRFVARSLSLNSTSCVLDIATGTGDLALAIAKRPERPYVVGLDIVPIMLQFAQTKIDRSGLSVSLLAADSLQLPFPNAFFDAITIAFGIRNISHRLNAIVEIYRILKPGGRFYILEFAIPKKPLLRFFYIYYLNYILPWLGGIISGDRASYQYLAESIVAFPSPFNFRIELEAAGFINLHFYSLSAGIVWLYIAEKPFKGF